MQKIQTIRSPKRLLFQVSAGVLALPVVAAFLPTQLLAPRPVMAMLPIPTPAQAPAASPAFLATRTTAPHRAERRLQLLERKLPLLSGMASWYGSVLGGHRTASGEAFDPEALTACHPTLPFGTLVRVVNLLNHRTVTVRINDRGVLAPSRVIDLSVAAANELGMVSTGVAPVRLEIQKPFTEAKTEPAPSAGTPANTQ